MLIRRDHNFRTRALASYRAGPGLNFARLPLAGKTARGPFSVIIASAIRAYSGRFDSLESALDCVKACPDYWVVRDTSAPNRPIVAEWSLAKEAR